MRKDILGDLIQSDIPVVYMTKDISADGLMNAYLSLGWQPEGNTAVKLSTGEPPNSNYLRTDLIKDVVDYVDGTIVECNTAYGGQRSSTAMHYQVAEDHGFIDIADFQILDEDGSLTLPVENGTVLQENYVEKAFADYNSYLVLSHFKGHAMAGYGGAVKIFPLVWHQAREKHGYIVAEQAVVCGAVSKMLFWNPWQKLGNRFAIT